MAFEDGPLEVGSSTKATWTESDEERLSLQVSSPALLLNHMAERYSSTSRILMEFVDNAFDDAEALFDGAQYSRPFHIDVFVSRKNGGSLRIRDNSRGMAPDTLSRVVMRVGESRKRGVSFVNGQFGFGMQAFRAACAALTVRSRGAAVGGKVGLAPAYQIVVRRNQSDGFLLQRLEDGVIEAEADGGSAPLATATGTEVVLDSFDKQWIDASFAAQPVLHEIESHFERLLDRGNLQVQVWDADEPTAPPLVAKPVDYSTISPGASVLQRVDLGGGQIADCNLCVLPAGRANVSAVSGGARFFVSGRRISACGATPSFATSSSNRWTVWAHPQVAGYIDISGAKGGPLQPVITRDEFKNTRGRQSAYEAIMDACEGPLQRAIEAANAAQSEQSLSRLEDTLTQVLAKVAQAEREESAVHQEELKRLERQRRREAARAKRLALEAQRAEEEAARAEEEANAARPMSEKVADNLNSLLDQALNTAANALDPSRQAAEDEAKMREENEARARAAEEKKAAAEARRAAARRRRLAPSGEEFTVRLVRGLDGDGAEGGDPVARGGSERSRLVGTTILVDSLHPDFQSRWRQTRQGAAKVDERLCGYLATIVSSHYRERAYQAAERQRVDYAQAYEEMIGTYCRLEDGLRSVLPQLIKEMNEQQQQQRGKD